jgi:selenocysteine lyase/cysteine desulfurase
VLEFFDASPDEYAVIFTPNASGACRLVGESYPFRRGTRFVLLADNHNSVNGLREYARRSGARPVYVPITGTGLRTGEQAVRSALGGLRRRGGLFAYPAQSNFTGVQHPLEWIELAHSRGYDVLLDAAAFLPANRLDLSVLRPDFVAVSWYKVFGYPTGVGCLLARRSALARLRRPWFSGGTIHAVSVLGGWHTMASDETAFEDGTLNFLSIPDVINGLDWIRAIGISEIHTRVAHLTRLLLTALTGLRHDNGAPMIRLYGPADPERRGGTIAFNLLTPSGELIDERLVARDAAAANISLRTGCFCNPGVGEAAFHIDEHLLRRAARTSTPLTLDAYLNALGLPTGGAIRASVGPATTPADLTRCTDFLTRTYRDHTPRPVGLTPRERC